MEGITYRKTADVTDFQRCNRPGQPIFYCATSIIAPFFEIKPDVGDFIILFRWKTNQLLPLTVIAHTDEVFRDLKSNREPQKFPLSKDDVDDHINDFILKELSKIFIKNNTDAYKLSTAIFEYFTGSIVLNSPLTKDGYKPDSFPALLYPSISMWANGDNLAIKPTYDDQYMNLERADLMNVRKVEPDKLNMVTVDHAIFDKYDHKIPWKNKPEIGIDENGQLVDGPVTLHASGGGWYCYDMKNKNVKIFN